MRHLPLKWDGPLSVMKAGNHEQKDFETSLDYEKDSRKANNSITGQENNIKKQKNMFIQVSFCNSIVFSIS